MGAETLRKVHQAKWVVVQQATEFQDRIKALEAHLEDERLAQEQEREKQAQLLARTREAADVRKQEADERQRTALAAATRQMQEAEDSANTKIKRAEDEVARARRREEMRVNEVQRLADARTRECEDQTKFELEQLHGRCIQRQRAIEESCFVSGKQASEVLGETRRHTMALEKNTKELRAAEEIAAAHKEARMEEWTATQKAQTAGVERHRKGLLEMEKRLHQRTLERTFGRATDHLRVDDSDLRGIPSYLTTGNSAALTCATSPSSPVTSTTSSLSSFVLFLESVSVT